jgi:hypothetical protein
MQQQIRTREHIYLQLGKTRGEGDMKIKRYKLKHYPDEGEHYMAEDPDGEWYKHSELQQLCKDEINSNLPYTRFNEGRKEFAKELLADLSTDESTNLKTLRLQELEEKE